MCRRFNSAPSHQISNHSSWLSIIRDLIRLRSSRKRLDTHKRVSQVSNMKNPLLVVLVLGLTLSQLSAAEVPDAWKPFQFMMGDWVGVGTEKSSQGTGEFSLKFDLDQKILVRKNRAKLGQATAQLLGGVHEDLMVIYPQVGTRGFRADYFDNEGNVIHYGITFPEHKVVFESDEPASPTKFRLTYELKPDGVLKIDFAIAPPGKSFQTCLSGEAKRK